MKVLPPDGLEKRRIVRSPADREARGTMNGRFVVKGPQGRYLMLIVSTGRTVEWQEQGLPLPAFDHVSVSVCSERGGSPTVLPSWTEMQWVKLLCWEPHECVVQYHPPQVDYVNRNEVLHLWKPVGVTIPLPPKVCV